MMQGVLKNPSINQIDLSLLCKYTVVKNVMNHEMKFTNTAECMIATMLYHLFRTVPISKSQLLRTLPFLSLSIDMYLITRDCISN